MEIISKLPDTEITIFTIMSALANQHNAINLSQGFPDFDVDPELIGLVSQFMLKGQNQYAPMQGVYGLREKIAEKTLLLYGRKYDPETEITVTSGATEALFASNTPIQCAYEQFLGHAEAYESLAAFYQQKRALFLSLINESRFMAIPCQGTYFQMLDYSCISNEPDIDFAKRLVLEHGVAAIPPSVFYHTHDDHRVLRFCFAKKDETLKHAAERLCNI